MVIQTKLELLKFEEMGMPPTCVAQPFVAKRRFFPGVYSDPIFDEGNTPVAGFSAMLNLFFNDEYLAPGVHEDHEGFFVVAGQGKMMLDDVEHILTPGSTMIVPAGVTHAIKKNGNEDLKIFIYHFPR